MSTGNPHNRIRQPDRFNRILMSPKPAVEFELLCQITQFKNRLTKRVNRVLGNQTLYNEPYSSKTDNDSKKNDLLLTGLLARHYKLKYHINKLGLVESANCHQCVKESDISKHILRVIHILGKGFLDSHDSCNIAPIMNSLEVLKLTMVID